MKFRQSLFWDVDPDTIDVEKNATYIIERIMDFGNDDEVRWMWKTYTKDRLLGVIGRSRSLHDESRIFWKIVIDAP
jgi:hypothetical protein